MRALLGIAIGLALIGTSAEVEAGVKVGDRAKEFLNVRNAKNKRMRLRQHKGKIVVVTFGASWCPPCRKELPALEKVARRIRTAGHDVRFVAINFDSSKKTGMKFMAAFKLECIRAGFDPQGGTKGIYDPKPMPSTYIIDPRGVVRHIHKGYRSGDEKDLDAEIMKLVRKYKQ